MNASCYNGGNPRNALAPFDFRAAALVWLAYKLFLESSKNQP
ncbi:hypothetical protein FDUTEX481_07822 [Tolypothrix sp. PCC 7601]|nr:hypothetical protein FDUTEX481_07822 [Tolypothrix sp. PCC 7601]